jgi:hypothetical protein
MHAAALKKQPVWQIAAAAAIPILLHNTRPVRGAIEEGGMTAVFVIAQNRLIQLGWGIFRRVVLFCRCSLLPVRSAGRVVLIGAPDAGGPEMYYALTFGADIRAIVQTVSRAGGARHGRAVCCAVGGQKSGR